MKSASMPDMGSVDVALDLLKWNQAGISPWGCWVLQRCSSLAFKACERQLALCIAAAGLQWLQIFKGRGSPAAGQGEPL
jgi:hypothetical protein